MNPTAVAMVIIFMLLSGCASNGQSPPAGGSSDWTPAGFRSNR